MSDPRDRSVLGSARSRGPLQSDPFRPSRWESLAGPRRGTTVVAEGPKAKKTPPKSQPKTEGREISVVGTYDNPWKTQGDEVDAMAHDRWSPTTDDFVAVAGGSAVRVDSWGSLMQVILTNGDAESAAGSISRINIFTHANSDSIAFSGQVSPGAGRATVMLNTGTGISQETLNKMNSGIFINVASNNKKLASKKFVLADIQKRFTKDAVIVIYACHVAVNGAFVQRIADTFQVKVRAFNEVIGYFPNFDQWDPSVQGSGRVTNRRTVGVGHNSKVRVHDFHELDKSAADRTPKAGSPEASKNEDDDD